MTKTIKKSKTKAIETPITEAIEPKNYFSFQPSEDLIENEDPIENELDSKICFGPKTILSGRKKQIFDELCSGPKTIAHLANNVGISKRNVSSILTYLRRDGIILETLKTPIGNVIALKH